MRKYVSSFFAFTIFTCVLPAQTINPLLLKKTWPANWIAVPNTPAKGYGIYLFRKNILLQEKPESFIVHVSADNRYKLFINEKMVSLGPARGDMSYWNFETIDIASYILPGKNTIAAIVWNEGDIRPEGQISNRTAFLLQGNTAKEEIINSNTNWKCFKNEAYTPLNGIGYNTYYVSGPGEMIDMHAMPQGWMNNNFDDQTWPFASKIGWSGATPKGIGDISGWMLVPSPLPQMEISLQRFASIRKTEGHLIPESFLKTKSSLVIPANKQVTFLVDQSFLTNAYPVMSFSKGNHAGILFTYAEALFSEVPDGPGKTFRKGNRNDIEGKIIKGRKDSVVSNGQENQEFTTLNWRTFRYIQIKIITKEEPLVIEDLYSLFTGYPFKLNATFDARDKMLDNIFETGWRTARSCAMETYMDCPYYEQLQYIGDARIQALVSLYNSGDDRLVRNAIDQMDHSRIAEGITLSRHPSFSPQQIPTFSLWYIGMLHDYWIYRDDKNFVAEKLQGVRNILWFYSKYQQADGSLKNVPYWMFTDWVHNKPGWSGGTAPYGKDGSSGILDLQLLWALQLASDMELKLGSVENAGVYKNKSRQLQNTIHKKYWDNQRNLFADTDDRDLFSQHANTLAILTNTITGKEATALAKKILVDTSLAPASIYFKYYQHQALVKAGLGNDYLKWLDKWKENIEMGLTTWAEISEIDAARSDCHAWGSSPNIEFFRTVLGIDSDAPGFKKVKIEPHLSELKNVQGKTPHPDGFISANYQFTNGRWKIEIILPGKVSGRLIWKNKSYPLLPGKSSFNL